MQFINSLIISKDVILQIYRNKSTVEDIPVSLVLSQVILVHEGFTN